MSSVIRFLISFLCVAMVISEAQAQTDVDATMVDSLQNDVNMDGMVNPGDTVRYSVDIINNGPSPATNVMFDMAPDANSTLLTLQTTPIARNDNYDSIGNVGIVVPAGSGVLTNDNDPDGGPVMAVAIMGGASANGGNVGLAADGSFSYNPPAGFVGVDSFTYSVLDNEGQGDMATVFVTVSEMIWFVDDNAMCPCDGRLSNPFDDLAVSPNSFDVNATDSAGDSIFVASGNYTGGLTLLNNQLLIGDGSSSDLGTITGILLPLFSAPLPVFSGVDPVIGSAAGNGINLSMNNTVRGLTVGNTPMGTGITDTGGTVGTLAISESSITGTGGGIQAANGGLLNVSFDSLTASSATEEGINLQTVDGSFTVGGGTIDTTGIRAVDINGNPSVALSVTLASVSANGGPNGIRLEDTTGSFSVTGSGGACTPGTPTCTGGRIQNMTGANNTPQGNGVYLNNTSNVSLNLVRINDHGNFALNGTSVTGFNLTNSLVDGVNGNAGNDGSVIFFNLLGSANITGSDISGAFTHTIRIFNNTGTLDRFTMSGSTLGPGNSSGSAFNFEVSNATGNVTLDNNTITRSAGTVIALQSNNGGTSDWVVTNNNVSNDHPGMISGASIQLGATGSSNVTFSVSSNMVRDGDDAGLRFLLDTMDASASMDGIIDGNFVGVSGVPDSGAADGNGIQVTSTGNGTITTQISNNTIFQSRFNGMQLQAREGSGVLNAAVTNNTIAEPSAANLAFEGLLIQSGVAAPDTNTVCANVTGNSLNNAGPALGDDFFLAQVGGATVNLPGYAGAPLDVGAVTAFFIANNPMGPPVGGAFAAGPNGFVDLGACPTPMMAPVVHSEDVPVPANGTESEIELFADTENVELSVGVVPAFHGAVSAVNSRTIVAAGSPAGEAPSGASVMLGLGNLDPGQQVTIIIDVQVNSPFPVGVPQICSQGLVAGDNFTPVLTDDPDLPGDADPTCTPVVAPLADLTISKADSADPVFAGEELTYTVTVDNAGPDDATNVVVTDTLPAGVTFVSTSGCAEDPNGVPMCSLGTIAAGGNAMYTIMVMVDIGTDGTITNTASVTSDASDPNPEDNTTFEDTLVLAGADLSITKTDSEDPVAAGDQLVYTVTVDNAGPADAENVVVTDTLPVGVSLVSTMGCSEDPAGVPICSLGTIVNGANAMYTITVDVDPSLADGAMLSNSVTVTSDTQDQDPNNNSAVEDTMVVREVDIEVTSMESTDPVVAGSGMDNLVHTITATNNGPSDASGVEVGAFITWPPGVVLESVVPSGSGSWNDVNPGVWTIGDLADGASETLTITFTVEPSAAVGTDVIDTEAQLNAVNETETNDGNDATLVETSIAREIDLVVTKTDDPDPVVAGLEIGGLEYVVTVTNNGPSDGTGVIITDPAAAFPPGVTLEMAVPSAGMYDNTDWVVDLPFGATETLTMTVTVGPTAPIGDDAISNTATVTGSGGDEMIINPEDDSATEFTTVLPTTATWTVMKDFLDDATASVTATLSCTSGTVITPPAQVSEGSTADLTVEGFLMGPFGTTTCEVTESNLPPEYFQVSASEDCEVSGVTHEDTFDCEFVNAPIRAIFEVTKDFSDDNPAEVRVVLECNTGLPLMQEAMISEFGLPFDQIAFVVRNFQIGELDCDLFEEPVPDGYEPSYEASADPIDALYDDVDDDENGCHYTGIQTGTYGCDITDTLLPVDVVVNKDWIDENPEFNNPLWVNITLRCENGDIIGGYDCGNDECIEEFIDPDNPGGFEVFPHWDGSTTCSVTEEPEAGVLQDVDDCAAIDLLPGVDGECTIVNTRLYAGIPTLSQWGLMLMALMMLGVGMIGFRRFT